MALMVKIAKGMFPAVDEKEFDLLRRLIYREAGITLKDHKRTMVGNRLRKRLEVLGLRSYGEYYRYITENPRGRDELSIFVNCLTTNETFFMRHPEQLQMVVDHLYPAWKSGKPGRSRPFRIWSAACSSGEEPYSLAMLFEESKPGVTDHLEMIGSDINRQMLDRARLGEYNAYAVQKMNPERIRRFFSFEPGRDVYRLKGALQKQVRFMEHNLLTPFPENRFDIILCRNVLIYFDAESKQRVLEHLYNALNPGGTLITGYAESLFHTRTRFLYVQPTVHRKPETERDAVDA